MLALYIRPFSAALAVAGVLVAVALVLRRRKPRPVSWTAGGTVWVDDFRSPLEADHGEVGPDGFVYAYTLAAFLDEEADERESGETDFDRVVALALRSAAEDARARGLVTAEEFLSKFM